MVRGSSRESLCAKYRKGILPLGAHVLGRRPGANVNQLLPWVTGLWSGRDTLSDEHLICTSAVLRSRAVRLQAPARWVSGLQAMLFTRWAPHLNRPGRPRPQTGRPSGSEHGVDGGRVLHRQRARILDGGSTSPSHCKATGTYQHGQVRCGGRGRQAAITRNPLDTLGTNTAAGGILKMRFAARRFEQTVSPDADFNAGAPKLTALRGLLTIAAFH